MTTEKPKNESSATLPPCHWPDAAPAPVNGPVAGIAPFAYHLVLRRIDRTVAALDEASGDGLQGFDRTRIDDLVIRDVAEFLIIKKHRAAAVERLVSSAQNQKSLQS